MFGRYHKIGANVFGLREVNPFFERGNKDNALDGLCKIHINTMSDFKTRLIDEKAQLNEKIEKLEAFQQSENFQKIDSVQMTLLNCQVLAMRTYSQILLERIARLPVEA